MVLAFPRHLTQTLVLCQYTTLSELLLPVEKLNSIQKNSQRYIWQQGTHVDTDMPHYQIGEVGKICC
jgi:hypothetical protein